LKSNGQTNIALLVFSRSAEEEIKSKPFLAQKRLAESLNSYTRNLAKSSELPVFLYDETNQIGTDFGTRFSNSLQTVFAQGYDAVITIGSDSPGLNINHIDKAKRALKNGSTVLGPSHDGGFYLLGISKENFDYRSFLAYSWNTASLCKEVINHFKFQEQNCIILQKLEDIDILYDLEKLSITQIQNIRLRNIIRAIRIKHPKTYTDALLNIFDFLPTVTFNKGSPFLIS